MTIFQIPDLFESKKDNVSTTSVGQVLTHKSDTESAIDLMKALSVSKQDIGTHFATKKSDNTLQKKSAVVG